MIRFKVSRMLLMSLVITLSPAVYPAQASCDRQCLINLAEDYLQALVSNDPGSLPLARKLKTVENLMPIYPGEGLWKTASAIPTNFKIFVPDPVSQEIGFMVVMNEEQNEENEQMIQVAFRLKLEQGEIIEAEHLINRDVDETSVDNLRTPRAPLYNNVPPVYRNSRQRLLSIGASYYDALVLSNGALAPFADDCVRHENGHQTSRNAIPDDPLNDFAVLASMGCAAQLNTQIYAYIDSIDHRRVGIADEETGLVFGLSHFRHEMDETVYQLAGVPGHEEFIDERDAYDLSAVHIFKIWGGQIHEVEAVGYFTEYQTATGWD